MAKMKIPYEKEFPIVYIHYGSLRLHQHRWLLHPEVKYAYDSHYWTSNYLVLFILNDQNINNIPILDFLNSSQSFTEESLKFQKFPSVLQYKTLVYFQISQWYEEEKNIFEEQRLR